MCEMYVNDKMNRCVTLFIANTRVSNDHGKTHNLKVFHDTVIKIVK